MTPEINTSKFNALISSFTLSSGFEQEIILYPVCIQIWLSYEHERKINIDDTVVNFAFFVSTFPPTDLTVDVTVGGFKSSKFPVSDIVFHFI